MKIRIFKFLDRYDDVMIYFWTKRDMKSYSRLIFYPNMKKNGGFPFILKSYNGFCVGIFLAIYVMYWENSRARTSILNGRPFRYQWSWNAIHGIKLLGKLWRLLWKKKNGNPMLRTDVTRENAHAIVRERIFLKCLKWLETYSYLIKKWFWAF